VILKKNILQVHMRKKKFLYKTIVQKNSCTYSGLEKKFWQDVFWVDTLNFVSRLFDFSIWIRGILCTIMCPPSDGFFFTFVAPVVTNLDTCFLNFKITAGVVI